MAHPKYKHHVICPNCGGRGVETTYVRPAHLPYDEEVRQIEVVCTCCGGDGVVHDVLEVIGDGERLVIHPSSKRPRTEV